MSASAATARCPGAWRARAAAPALLLLAGCASVGGGETGERPLPQGAEVARSVVLCETTVEQLGARLGAPSRDGRLGRQRVVSWIVAYDPLVKYLAVLVNERGVVTDVYWDVPTEIPWVPTDRCARPAP